MATKRRTPLGASSTSYNVTLTPEDTESTRVLIHPENIFPGAAIREVREEGVAAVLLSVRSTVLWSSTTVITVYRDPSRPADTPLPRFLCVDGMHRVTAARRLIAEDSDFGGWPPGWKDERGKVRLECSVLLTVPSPEKLIKYAVLLNQHTGALVETSYLDILNAIRTARQVVLSFVPANARALVTLTPIMRKK
jgi:hypothetical protein